MPTGYTQAISDGSDTTAAGFLKRYAYAFTPLIGFRDSDRDKTVLPELPKELSLDAYEYERVADYKAEFERHIVMTDEQWAEQFSQFEEERKNRRDRHVADKAGTEAAYRSVLASLESQVVDEASEAQKFLAEAINAVKQSLNYDCFEIAPFEPYEGGMEAWRNHSLEDLARRCGYAESDLDTERARVAQRYQWLQEIKAFIAKVEEAEAK